VLKRVILALVVIALVDAAAVYWLLSGDAVRSTLQSQATAWLGQPVRIGSARAQIFPRIGISLRDVRVGEPVRLTLNDVDVSTGLRALLSRRVEDAEVVIANSRIDLPLSFSLPESGGAAQQQSSSSGVTIASVRAIRLDGVRVVSRGREITVSADSSLIGSRLNLSRFQARSGKTQLDASGVVDLGSAFAAKLEASANELDFDDLVALADAFTPPQRQTRRGGPLVAGKIASKLTAARGRAAGVELKNLSGALSAQGDQVSLSPVAFDLFGGHYEGAVRATIGSNLSVALTSRISNLDVAQLATFGGAPDTVSGTLSGSGRFTGAGRDFSAAVAAASGSGDAAIVNGTIKRLELVRTVILYFGKPAEDAPASSGDKFNRLAASFTLGRQVLRSDSLQLQSPDVDIAAAGTLAIPTKTLDGKGDLILSESLSAQAGSDLVRYAREGNRVVLPATIGGTLERPRVMIDAATAVKRGLRNEVERRLKGLFDRLKPPSQD